MHSRRLPVLLRNLAVKCARLPGDEPFCKTQKWGSRWMGWVISQTATLAVHRRLQCCTEFAADSGRPYPTLDSRVGLGMFILLPKPARRIFSLKYWKSFLSAHCRKLPEYSLFFLFFIFLFYQRGRGSATPKGFFFFLPMHPSLTTTIVLDFEQKRIT